MRTQFSRSRRCVWGLTAACSLFCFFAAAGEIPHRRLSTSHFKGPRELNNIMGAFFPEHPNPAKLQVLAQRISQEAAREGVDLKNTSPQFWQKMVSRLAGSHQGQDLLSALRGMPDKFTGTPGSPEVDKRLQSLKSLQQAFEKSPFKDSIEKFVMRSWWRNMFEENTARPGEKPPKNLRSYIKDLRELMEKADISEDQMGHLRSLFNKTRVKGKEWLEWLQGVSVNGSSDTLTLPSFTLPVLLGIAGLVAAGMALWMKRNKTVPQAPPALPDINGLARHAEGFSEALLQFYRRLCFEAGLPFQGRTINELQEELYIHFPGIHGMTETMNAAFYELWYGGQRKTPEEMHKLTGLLADCLARTGHKRRPMPQATPGDHSQ